MTRHHFRRLWVYVALTAVAMVASVLFKNAEWLLAVVFANLFMVYYHGTRFSEYRYRAFFNERADVLEGRHKSANRSR